MSYQDVKDKLYHGHRKIANNTYLTLGDGGTIDTPGEYVDMRLHNNLIVRFYPDYFQLYSAGWHTTTTKDRLNLALKLARINCQSPYSLPSANRKISRWRKIYQVDYQWYYGNYHKADLKFYVGMKLDYTGKVYS